ncbi:hypothetical protein [Thermocrinis minervae]|uniref:Uncharacterized protein n=1 Tax=Thermocrinis minervae TaxID=381751 RepID=A0A1M6SEN9_9AQUI|nr:hypothetical protein [Thermocrinis minervae]SHK43156.1 hypothetical protein SAMN05444391_1002 [Thermocrinis minervae]
MKVQIIVNGKEVKLKDFPKRVAYNLVLGFTKSLNLEEEPREITLHVWVEQEDRGSSQL